MVEKDVEYLRLRNGVEIFECHTAEQVAGVMEALRDRERMEEAAPQLKQLDAAITACWEKLEPWQVVMVLTQRMASLIPSACKDKGRSQATVKMIHDDWLRIIDKIDFDPKRFDHRKRL